MPDTYPCWKCGKPLEGLILPMSRREECSHCGADQHVCRMCIHFDGKGRGDCSEERAELVSDRERANFCDYFSPSQTAFSGQYEDKAAKAKAELAALFGEEPEPAAESRHNPQDEQKELTPAEIAERKLREMLGG